MNDFDSKKDYYGILGADEQASRRDINRLYKRQAARHHPDRGGNEEKMKSLNEAYRILNDDETRQAYDLQRQRPPATSFTPVASPPAQDIGLFGQGLSAFLCLFVGLFLLLLVRFQWIWFLWPLAILAVFVVFFGILMARSAMHSYNASLPLSNPLRRYTRLQEVVFWTVVGGGVYGLYLLLSAVE